MNIQLFSKSIKLPKPQYDSNVSIEESLLKRRCIRSYKSEPLAIAEISQLLRSAQGVTNRKGFRTAPSAGVRTPMDLPTRCDMLSAHICYFKGIDSSRCSQAEPASCTEVHGRQGAVANGN